MKTKNNKTRQSHRRLVSVITILCLLPVLAVPALATEGRSADPLAPLTAFKDLLVSVVQILGICGALYGFVQVGLSLQSHDPSQRTQGLLVFVGGILLALAPTILNYIGISV